MGASSLLQSRYPGFECCDFSIFGLELLVEFLHPRQGHAVGIQRGDVLIIDTQTESGVKILGYRPDVSGVSFIADKIPARDRHCRDPLQHTPTIHNPEVLFQLAVGGLGEEFHLGSGFQKNQAALTHHHRI